MNKKVAVIIKYFREMTQKSDGFRGAGLYINSFIYSLSLCSDVDIYCEDGKPLSEGSHIKNVFLCENPPSTEELEQRGYDFVWCLTDKVYKSDKFLTFTLQHSHSRIYRQKYIRRPYELFIKRIFNPSRYYTKSKIKEYKKVFKTTDLLFANSKNAQDDYVNLCGIDISEVPLLNPMIKIPGEPIKEKEKHEYFTFGMSAITFDLKGGYIFLEALHNLKKTNKNFRARIIYPHYKKNFILRFFVQFWGLKKYVEFLDFQNSMADFYNSVDCIVMPSREETFGFVAAEGMANKLPVIVSSASGICDIIENEKNGFIFDIRKNPVKNLTLTLLKVINADNLGEIAQKGYETALNNSIEHHSQKLNKILDSILTEKRNKQ